MLASHHVHLFTLPDAYGAPLAEYYFYPEKALLYICWHGQLTANEVIRGAIEAGKWMDEYPYRLVMNDKRDSGGDWSDALPWLQYEWLPRAVKTNVQAMAYILSPDLHAQIVSRRFIDIVQNEFQVALFTSETEAWNWLQTR